jgi:hypothetical protein
MNRALALSPVLFLALACGGATIAEDGSGGGGGSGAGGGGGGGAGTGGTAQVGPCSLALVASGELPASGATNLSGPAVAAMANSFILGYRQWDGSSLRLVLRTLSVSGALGNQNPFELPSCASTVGDDGVSIAFSGQQGLATTSLPNCGNGAGAAFVPLDASGLSGEAKAPQNATFKALSLWRASLAPGQGANEFELFYRVETGDSPIQRILMQGADFKSAPVVTPFDQEDASFVGEATWGPDRAYAAVRSASVVVKLGVASGDSVNIESELQLPFAKTFGITAWPDSVALSLPTPEGVLLASAHRSAGWKPAETWTIPNSADAQTTDIDNTGDHLLVLHTHPGSFSVCHVPGANGTLATSPQNCVKQPASFDGKLAAMAALADRVAVVWLSAAEPAAGAPAGGWAVLECKN